MDLREKALSEITHSEENIELPKIDDIYKYNKSSISEESVESSKTFEEGIEENFESLPVFIKLERFEEILMILRETSKKIAEIRKIFRELENLEERKKNLTQEIAQKIKDVENSVIDISEIFSGKKIAKKKSEEKESLEKLLKELQEEITGLKRDIEKI